MLMPGVSRGGNFGTVVVVCRDIDGSYLGSSVLVIHGLLDPTTLELVACREALTLATNLGLDHLQVASYYKGVVKDVQDGS